VEAKLKLLEKFTEDTERELVDLKYALEFDKQKFTTLLQKYEADLVKVLRNTLFAYCIGEHDTFWHDV
jgi:signal transduction protein with GAF and PtsI domain